MKRVIPFLFTAVLLLSCVLGGCAQQKSVTISADGIVTSNDSEAQALAPSSTISESPAQTPEPTPAPTEAPGWVYSYNRDLVNKDNVLFTLKTIEYDYDAKTLSVVGDYTNTGTYNQLITCIYATINSTDYTLDVKPETSGDTAIFLTGGEKRTVTFSYTFTDEELAGINLQKLKSIELLVFKLEASNSSQPDDFILESFDWVNIALPPAA